ncbi:hypothetical protein AVEN_35900-1 [Araneus ventricosus]|uniref:Uncharacterized protein n=1 Tax=Araneus ventricosus TaxID=182803 RepID=A0A4Y2PX77_ARAVE|nr:hypothetical protein AVEN_187331-1 [Araneus ventricosus]GBN55180.1 hypothetical protein AVEN_35900-1 [Araneus ventricosus]
MLLGFGVSHWKRFPLFNFELSNGTVRRGIFSPAGSWRPLGLQGACPCFFYTVGFHKNGKKVTIKNSFHVLLQGISLNIEPVNWNEIELQRLVFAFGIMAVEFHLSSS